MVTSQVELIDHSETVPPSYGAEVRNVVHSRQHASDSPGGSSMGDLKSLRVLSLPDLLLGAERGAVVGKQGNSALHHD